MTALKIENLSKSFGGIQAVLNYNLELPDNTITGLIGPNGAGKTSIFNLISGIYRPDSGQVFLNDKEITHKALSMISRSGIARTFQNIRLFNQMTVLDNIKTAFHRRAGYHFGETILGLSKFYLSEKKIDRESMEYLNYFGLTGYKSEFAKNLCYGDQRRLEIARALASEPKVLLLDEPAAGMNQVEVEELIKLIRKVQKDFGLSILLIEHQMPVVIELCRSIQVLNFGRLIASGNPSEVISNPEVIQAYLGEMEPVI
ncbi:ABC transporter ATP-binding protein [Candidatus Desantisbacteria bacterium]|nr:ABC transporter ATP-binding protein [Candidatus Desantisbacteria bacterium]